MNLEVANLSAHTGQKAPCVVLALPPRIGDKQLPLPCPALFMDVEKKTGSYLAQDVLTVTKLTKMVLDFWSSYLECWDYGYALHHLATCGAGANSGHHVCLVSTLPTQMLGQACLSPLPYQCRSAFQRSFHLIASVSLWHNDG